MVSMLFSVSLVLKLVFFRCLVILCGMLWLLVSLFGVLVQWNRWLFLWIMWVRWLQNICEYSLLVMLKCGGLCRIVLMLLLVICLICCEMLLWLNCRWLLVVVEFGFGDYGLSVCSYIILVFFLNEWIWLILVFSVQVVKQLRLLQVLRMILLVGVISLILWCVFLNGDSFEVGSILMLLILKVGVFYLVGISLISELLQCEIGVKFLLFQQYSVWFFSLFGQGQGWFWKWKLFVFSVMLFWLCLRLSEFCQLVVFLLWVWCRVLVLLWVSRGLV